MAKEPKMRSKKSEREELSELSSGVGAEADEPDPTVTLMVFE